MRRCTWLVVVGLLMPGLNVFAQEPTSHQQAIALIKKLGAEVIESEEPRPAVKVVLTGSDNPSGCLPLLKNVRHLQTCDL